MSENRDLTVKETVGVIKELIMWSKEQGLKQCKYLINTSISIDVVFKEHIEINDDAIKALEGEEEYTKEDILFYSS